MCPSWKATRQRVHSPKGRASLIREWLRLQGEAGTDVLSHACRRPAFFSGLARRWRNSRAQRSGAQDFSHEVYDAMAGCLACKSCAGQCPVKVNVPEFRSRFLELYHSRYLRPARDYLIASLEYTVPYLARVPGLYNALMGAGFSSRLLERHVGMVDSPLLSRFDFQRAVRHWQARPATTQILSSLNAQQRARSVILVQDAFTRYFETPLLVDLIELVSRLGYQVYLAPFSPNGKPLHVQGFLSAFNRAAVRNADQLRDLARFDIPLVGLDPAMTLVYRQEYLKVPGLERCPEVALLQEWLLTVLPERPGQAQEVDFRLLAHCTEKTNAPASTRQWEQVFERAGMRLKTQATGCCGMSGTYGHEARNKATSVTIFEQSWASQVSAPAEQGEALATGYSCRSQVKRLSEQTLRHPLQALLEVYRR
jgi:Fe-S oxidoreductase